MKAEITKIQRFSTHDGDGVRTTVFFRGCPLHCAWCHNPETWQSSPLFYYTDSKCTGCTACAKVCQSNAHIFNGGHTINRSRCTGCMKCSDVCFSGAIERCSFSLETDEILSVILQDRAFYGSVGGITLSGGEPMFQPEAAIKLLTKAKKSGITTAMETSGVWHKKYISQLHKICDTFLWDIKDTDEKRLFKNTGASLSQILENLYTADSLGCSTELRCILINGINAEEKHFSAIAEIYHSLSNCKGVRILPYHPYGSSKSVRLGMESNYSENYIPKKSQISSAKAFLKSKGVTVL